MRATAGLTPAGPTAQQIEWLWQLMLVLGTVTFVIFMVPLLAGLRRHRRSASAEGVPGAPDRPVSRLWLEGGGVALPLVVIGAVMVITVVVMGRISAEPVDPVVVDMTAHQWWWEVSYPDTGIVLEDRVVIPVGRPVELRLTSADVIHSFWVPPLGGKMDALPDGVNTLVIEASEPGEYRGQCAEFCGLRHARMVIFVEALPEAEFAAWRDEAAAGGGAP